MLKMATPMIVPVFTVIYNKSINTGIVAYILKIHVLLQSIRAGWKRKLKLSSYMTPGEQLILKFRSVYVQVYSLGWDKMRNRDDGMAERSRKVERNGDKTQNGTEWG